MSLPQPPVARRAPKRHERLGIVWTDDYAWLRDSSYPKVDDPAILDHLKAENAYFAASMAPRQDLVETLYAELKGRIKPDDSSVPVASEGYEYWWRFEPEAQYRVWLRQRPGGEAAVILDENAMAAGKGYFRLAGMAASPDGGLLAFATDEDGSERYTVRVKNLATGELLPDRIPNSSGGVAWAEDGRTLVHVELNAKLRPYRVRAHALGSQAAADPVLFEEKDPAFFVSVRRTRTRRYIVIDTGTHVTHELRLLDAAEPLSPVRLIAARRDGHRYSLAHAHGRFYILTNDAHENFRLVMAPEEAPEEANWEELIAGSESVYLTGITCFADFMAIAERVEGLSQVRIRTYSGEEHRVAFKEAAYTVGIGDNREFETDTLRLSYTSMVTPASVIDYVVATREQIVRKVQEVPSGYDPGLYTSRRLSAKAPDGTSVPVTVVHRRDHDPSSGRLLLYGYGAYGHGLDPSFVPSRLSLLDRGFAYALAHVRGGDELGWRWYRNGKLEKKKNSFKDFIACAEALIEAGYARPGSIAIRGGSAGGMLMGAVLNMRPELWRCAVLDVPFVDVLSTMLDSSLPLTPIEWPEWGDPSSDPEAFCRILNYSPYDNIKPQAYPPVLITAGLSDPRVTYWEPAKYAARLRASGTGGKPVLLKTNMGAGHFGRSGRYESLREAAEALVFILGNYDDA